MESRIILSSDYHYDNLVAEIYIANNCIAIISYDNDSFYVELLINEMDSAIEMTKLPYENFMRLFEQAKQMLKN